MQLALKIMIFCKFSPEIMSTQFRGIITEAHNKNLVDKPLMTKVSKKSIQKRVTVATVRGLYHAPLFHMESMWNLCGIHVVPHGICFG